MIRFFLPDEHPDEDDDELLPHCGLALAVIKNFGIFEKLKRYLL